MILFLQIMLCITIVSFMYFFFFGKVKVNGIINNSIKYGLIGAVCYTILLDVFLFLPVAIIVLLLKN